VKVKTNKQKTAREMKEGIFSEMFAPLSMVINKQSQTSWATLRVDMTTWQMDENSSYKGLFAGAV